MPAHVSGQTQVGDQACTVPQAIDQTGTVLPTPGRMIRSRLLLNVFFVLLALGCASRDGAPDSASTSERDSAAELDCGVPPGDVQIEGGIGVLRIGAPVAELRGRCDIVRDTTVPDNEGMPSRELMILLGTDTAVAEVVADSVWRLRLTSPRFSTGDVRVGTTVAELERYDGARALVGEGEVYVTVPETCGVSYRIAGAEFARAASARSPKAAIGTLPDTARVDLMLVFACPDSAERSPG